MNLSRNSEILNASGSKQLNGADFARFGLRVWESENLNEMIDNIIRNRKVGTKLQTATSLMHTTFPRFGQFMVNRGIVEEEAIMDALANQNKQTIPIGKMALREDLLNVKQVLQILNVQSDTAKRFGEIAIELGFLKKKDLEMLLELQIKLRPPIGEILVEMKKISKETLKQELLNYFKINDMSKKILSD